MSHGFNDFSFPANISLPSAWVLVNSVSVGSNAVSPRNPINLSFTSEIVAIGCEVPVITRYFRAGYVNVYKNNFIEPGSETFPKVLLTSCLLPINDLRILQLPSFMDSQSSPYNATVNLSNWIASATIKVWEFNP